MSAPRLVPCRLVRDADAAQDDRRHDRHADHRHGGKAGDDAHAAREGGLGSVQDAVGQLGRDAVAPPSVSRAASAVAGATSDGTARAISSR